MVYACAFVRACARVCVCACVRVCMRLLNVSTMVLQHGKAQEQVYLRAAVTHCKGMG